MVEVRFTQNLKRRVLKQTMMPTINVDSRCVVSDYGVILRARAPLFAAERLLYLADPGGEVLRDLLVHLVAN